MIKCHIEEGVIISAELEGSGKVLMEDMGIVIAVLADAFLKAGMGEGETKELLTITLAGGLKLAFKNQTKGETT